MRVYVDYPLHTRGRDVVLMEFMKCLALVRDTRKRDVKFPRDGPRL